MIMKKNNQLLSSQICLALVGLFPAMGAYELQNGGMEDPFSSNVAVPWTYYRNGTITGESQAKETATIHGGLASQKLTGNMSGGGTHYGIRQTIQCNIGDAFTFAGYVWPDATAANVAVTLRVDWAGGTVVPTNSVWGPQGSRRTWVTIPNSGAGNATSNGVTLFLHSARVANASALVYWDDIVAYHAYVPPAPTTGTPTGSTFDVNVDPGSNAPIASAEYAITIGGGAYTLSNHWVQADGSVGITEVWQTDATWGTTTVTGLAANTTYTNQVKARYSSTITQNTSLGAEATQTTTPGATPTRLAYTSVPTTGQQGLAFSVTVQAQDTGGNAANVTNDTTVALSVGSGSGSLSGTTTGVISNGQSSVTISGVIYSAADTMTLIASATGGMTLTAVTSGSIAFASAPTKLAYTSVPTAVTVGAPFNVTVQSQDAGGAPRGVTSDTTVALSVGSGSGTLGGTTNGTITTGNNSVTISGVTYDTVETMTLTASATAGMLLTAVTSGSISFLPGTQTLHWGANDANWTDTGAWYNIGTAAAATYNDVAPDAVVLEDTHSGTGDRTITLNTAVSPASVTMTADSKNFTISGSGAIGGSTGLSKGGAGTLTLGTANTFNGDTRIGAGTLILANSSALGGSTLDMDTNDSGSLSFDSVTAATLGGLAGTRNLALTNASGAAVALTVGNNDSNTTYLGVLSGSGGFTKTGTGTFTWGDATNAPMTYDGNTVIGQGTAVITRTNLLPYGTGKGDLTVNGILNIADLNINGLNGIGTINMTTAGGASLTIGNNDASGSFGGDIKRSGPSQNTVTKVGAGTQTLSGANAIGNATGWGFFINGGKVIAANAGAVGSYVCTVNAGTLEIANLALSTSLSLTLNNGATLMGSGGTTSAFGSGTRNATIGAGAAVTMSTAAATDTLTANSTIKGGDATALVTASGPGTIILAAGSATDAYAGKWKLTGGMLQLGDINALGNSTTKAIELAGGILEGRASAAGTYSTATTVSANSTMTPNQAGVGANHAFGTLSINNSTLNIGPGAQITAGTTETNTFSTTTLTGDATLNITNNDTRSMTVVLGAVGESGGARALAKQGTGTLVISGISTYTGGTTIAGGTLEIGPSGSIKGSVTVTGSQLKLSNASALEATAAITLPASPDTNTVNLNFAGTQTISALYFGAVQQNRGTWGAAGSGAFHESPVFTGTGILRVTTGPAASTATALGSSADPAAYGALVLTATVTGPGGTPSGLVTFKQGANVLGTAPLVAGVAIFNPGNALPPGGPYSLTADYAGDDNFGPSTSGALPQTVTTGLLTITGLTAQNKVYDGGTNATLSGTAGLSGVVGSDDVSLTGAAVGAFTDANVGTGKTVTVSGLSLTGADAGKYDLAALTLTADITAASTNNRAALVSESLSAGLERHLHGDGEFGCGHANG